MGKPNVIVLGGIGFVGRNFVQYLVENDLCDKIRVVDKVLRQTAHLSAKQEAALDKCEVLQRNLVNPSQIADCFKDGPWDYVFNLAAETKYSQTEEVYAERVLALTVNCATEAAKAGVKRFIDVSTAQIYDADKKPSTESSKIKPWTSLAKFKLKAEEDLKKIDGLDIVTVRPAIIYGPHDIQGITPRLIIGAVYKHLGEEMKLLWSKDLKMNTVHVRDVVRALFHLAEKGVKGEVYNLADKGDTNQETVSAFLKSIYGIKTGYQGSIISNLAKLNLRDATDEINDKHLHPWSQICKADGITNSPLSPYLDKELLYNNSLSVDGSKIEGTGFQYEVPQMTEELLREVLKEYVEIKAFPASLIQ